MTTAARLPHVLAVLDDHLQERDGRRLVVFLDYDGTLAPIARRPSEAHLPPPTKEALLRLQALATVVVVTGRDVADVRRLMVVDGLDWIGNHGLERLIDGASTDHPDAAVHRGALQAVADRLDEAVRTVDGAWVERKRHAVVVHDREVDDARLDEVRHIVRSVHQDHPALRVTPGRRIHEFRPPVDADKGRAVLDIIGRLGGNERVYPIYVGDDVTDEDGFRAVHTAGLGVLVRHDDRPTWARAALDGPEESARLLDALARHVALTS